MTVTSLRPFVPEPALYAKRQGSLRPSVSTPSVPSCLRAFVPSFLLAVLGCGSPPALDFPNRLIGADGQEIVLEDVLEVTNNSDLSEEEMREQLRALGIEDEELIDALVGG